MTHTMQPNHLNHVIALAAQGNSFNDYPSLSPLIFIQN